MEIFGTDKVQWFGKETFAASKSRGKIFVHVLGQLLGLLNRRFMSVLNAHGFLRTHSHHFLQALDVVLHILICTAM